MIREHRSWHREGLPVWGWIALGLLRVVSLVWALMPLALLLALWWWWTHGGRHDAPRILRHVAAWAGAAADSLFGK